MRVRRIVSLLLGVMLLWTMFPLAGIESFAEEDIQIQTIEPTAEPTPEPTAEPTPKPTPGPTAEPTPKPTPEPTAAPTPELTAEPTAEPTPELTAEPTAEPTPETAPEPTAEPAPTPTAKPTPVATDKPTSTPAKEPEPQTDAPEASEGTAAGSGFDAAYELKIGKKVNGEIRLEGLPEIYYAFKVKQSGRYRLNTEGALAVKASLWEGQGKVLARLEPNIIPEGESEPKHIQMTFELKKDRDYYLVVSSAENDQFGKYALLLNKSENETNEAENSGVDEKEAPTVTAAPTDKTTQTPAGKQTLLPEQRAEDEEDTQKGNSSKLPAPIIKYARASSNTEALLRWSIVPKATGYWITRSTSLNGQYTGHKTVKGSSVNSLKVKGQKGKIYYYKVTAYSKAGGVTVLGQRSDSAGVYFMQAPAINAVYQDSKTSARVEWKKVPGATGYAVMRSSGGSNFARLAITGSLRYIDKNANPGIKYSYKILSYKKVGTKIYYGAQSKVLSVQMLKKPVINSAINLGGIMTISWSAVKGASGYSLYKATSETSSFTKVGSYYSTNVQIPMSKLGKNNILKVAAFTNRGVKRVLGVFSEPIQLRGGETIYRALSIGNSDYWSLNYLPGTINDMNDVSSMLGGLTFGHNKYIVRKRRDLTAKEIAQEIAYTFKYAKEQDVSLFFYSGHGSTSSDSSGSLIGVDGSYLFPQELRNALDRIPGKIIVILDNCGSGSLIHQRGGDSTAGDPSSFNNAIIAAFSGGGSAYSRSGELRNDKYLVLTAAAHMQDSYEDRWPDGKRHGVFTVYLCEGGGWNAPQKKRQALLADKNNDSIVTLSEAYSYVKYKTSLDIYPQNVQVYPSGSSFPLFMR